MDSKADMLMYGNGERAIIDVMHRLAKVKKSTRLQMFVVQHLLLINITKRLKQNLLKLPVMM